MSGPEFFQTPMGRRFYEGTMPKLLGAVEHLADNIDGLREEVQRLADEMGHTTDELVDEDEGPIGPREV